MKGTKFQDLRDAGDPVELAAHYDREGADELVFLDITATVEGRAATLDVIARTAEQVFIPLTVGGGVQTDDDVNELLRAGADKVSLNSAAVRDPALLQRCADRFGTQCMVVAIDAKRRADAGEAAWEVFVDAGRTGTGRDAVEWAVEATTRARRRRDPAHVDGPRRHRRRLRPGAARAIGDAVRVPLIASGGAGELDHFAAALTEGGADAVLAASTLHFGQLTIARDQGAPRGRATCRCGGDRWHPTDRSPVDLDALRFDDRGLITVVAQDADNGDVLMVAWANREALERTLAEGRMVYWSRSRQELWRKGDTSGHVQHWTELLVDCDADAIARQGAPGRRRPATPASAPASSGRSVVPGPMTRPARLRPPC